MLDPLMVEVRDGRLPVLRLRAPRGWSTEDGEFADVDFVEYEDGSVHQIEADGRRHATAYRVAETLEIDLYAKTRRREAPGLPAECLYAADDWYLDQLDEEIEQKYERLGRLEPRWDVLEDIHTELRYIVRACRRYRWPVPEEWLPALPAVAGAPTGDTVDKQYPPRTPAEQERWYKGYVAEHEKEGTRPGRKEKYAAAIEHFGQPISYERLDDLHKRLSPAAWHERGRLRGNSRPKRDERTGPPVR